MSPLRLIHSPIRTVAAVLFLAVFASCYREASDATLSSDNVRYRGTAPWAVDDIRPGQTLEEIKRIRGEPRDQIGTTARPTFRWPPPRDTSVTFDSTGRAVDVFGSTVTAEGRTLVTRGMDAAAIQQVLGKGRVSRHSRPTGSGVISIGQTTTGFSVSYENGGAGFEIATAGETPGWVRAMPGK